MATKPELSATAAADDLTKLAPLLRTWTKHAAVSLGSYLGANAAVREAHKLERQADPMANTYGGECVMMTALRVYALFDSNLSKVSFQRVNKHLKREDVRTDLCQRAAGWGDGITSPVRSAEIERHILRFRQTYAETDWEAHGRLMSLRNINIAHLTEEEVKDSITYAELERFVALACRLVADLSLIATGLNSSAVDWIDDYSRLAYDFWADHFTMGNDVDLPPWNEVKGLSL